MREAGASARVCLRTLVVVAGRSWDVKSRETGDWQWVTIFWQVSLKNLIIPKFNSGLPTHYGFSS